MISRTAFRKKSLIYSSRGPQYANRRVAWSRLNAKECIQKKLRPEIEYPTCESLFRCLLIAGDAEIAPLIAKMTFINKSTKLREILRRFVDLNGALKGASEQKVQQLRKPLQDKPIFPILENRAGDHQSEFDDLSSLGPLEHVADVTTWFIADRVYLRESFRGVVPLLAFPVEELDSMENLFQFWNLDSRRLSRLVETKSGPYGMVSLHADYTAFLRDRAGFIKP
jgi:hypothetical protein